MISGVIDSIKEAEMQADSILEEATAKVRVITSEARQQAEEVVRQAEDKARAEAREQMRVAEGYAQNKAEAAQQGNIAKCEELKTAASANMDEAVQAVLERIG